MRHLVADVLNGGTIPPTTIANWVRATARSPCPRKAIAGPAVMVLTSLSTITRSALCTIVFLGRELTRITNAPLGAVRRYLIAWVDGLPYRR